MAKVGILGAGSWGTALAVLLYNNGNEVTVWSIDKNEVEMLQKEREHKSKLPGVRLPQDIRVTNDIKEGMEDKDFLVLAVPSVYTRSTARSMKPYIKNGQKIVNVAKGIEADFVDFSVKGILEACLFRHRRIILRNNADIFDINRCFACYLDISAGKAEHMACELVFALFAFVVKAEISVVNFSFNMAVRKDFSVCHIDGLFGIRHYAECGKSHDFLAEVEKV